MYDRVPQVRSFRSWAVPGWNQRDRLLLQLAASVLGDGKNSRLYQALVYELQLAVEADASVLPFELASLFTIDMTLKPGVQRVQADSVVDQELERFLKSGPTAEELQRAQTKIRAGVIRGLERVGGFYGKATTLAQGELYDGDPAFFRTALDWVSQATPDEVLDAARRWLSRGHHQLDVLPYGERRTTDSRVDRSTGPPEVDTLPQLSFPAPERARLGNGMDLILVRRATVPVVTLSLQFDAGFAADWGRKSGTASFTLAMMDESTATRSALEISAEAESLGAEISTASDLDTSRVSLSALAEHLAPSIDLYADVVRNPAFAPEEIERLRARWLASIEQEQNDPMSMALRTLPPLIYGSGHPYGIPFTGSGDPGSISQLVRDDLSRFHRDWIRSDNATMFVVGDTTMKEVLPLLEAAFGDWRPAGGRRPTKSIGTAALPERSRIILIDKPDSPQSLILAGHLAPPTGVENDIEIELMNDVIGGQYSARVNQNLRADKHWSYGAYTFLRDARRQRPWIIYAPVQTDRTVDAIRELRGELGRLLGSAPVTPEELTRVIRSNAYSLPGRYETSRSVMQALQDNQRFGRPDDYVAGLGERFGQVDLDQIRAAATQVLRPDRLTWVVVGDRREIEAGLRELDLAELEFMDAEGRFLD
jgi:zinc protease